MDWKQTVRRIIALQLCALTLVSAAAPAFADTLAYTNKKTTVYVEKAGKLKLAGTESKGTEVTVKDINGAWAMVEKDGNVAYMKLSALTPKTETENKADEYGKTVKCSKAVYAAADGVKVYKSDDEDSAVLATLTKGQKQTMVAYNDVWCMLKNGKSYGYALRSELSLEKIAVQQPEATQAPAAEKITKCSKYIYAAADGVKVYASDDTASSVKDTLTLGQKVKMTAYSDTWCQIKSGSKIGYVLRSEVSLQKIAAATPAPTATPVAVSMTKCDKTGYAVSDGVKVYAEPDTGSNVLSKLSKNTAVNVVGYSEKWCQVKNGKYIGYVQQSDLSDSEIVDLPSSLSYGDKGDAVKLMQTRLKELGYFNGTIGGNYLEQTRSAVAVFQKQNGLTSNGEADSKTLTLMFSDKAVKYDASKVEKSEGSTASGPSNALVQEMDWWSSGIQQIFARGTTATVTDCATGISWKERRNGGTNHADVQPLTAADTAAMKSAVGKWSWDRRAIWVTINGKNYAASMNCMPHGSGSIKDNDFDGHHCIHFTNSRTHGTNSVCSLHQAAIKKALKYSPK